MTTDVPLPEDFGPGPLLELAYVWTVAILAWIPIVAHAMGLLVPALSDSLAWLFRPLFLQLGVSVEVATVSFIEVIHAMWGPAGSSFGSGLMVLAMYLVLMLFVAMLVVIAVFVSALFILFYAAHTVRLTGRALAVTLSVLGEATSD